MASDLTEWYRARTSIRDEFTFALTADVSEAHRQIPFHPSDWHLLGCQVKEGAGCLHQHGRHVRCGNRLLLLVTYCIVVRGWVGLRSSSLGAYGGGCGPPLRGGWALLQFCAVVFFVLLRHGWRPLYHEPKPWLMVQTGSRSRHRKQLFNKLYTWPDLKRGLVA